MEQVKKLKFKPELNKFKEKWNIVLLIMIKKNFKKDKPNYKEELELLK